MLIAKQSARNLVKFGPTVGGPLDVALHEQGRAVHGGRIAMADEDVLAVEVVDSTVAGGLVLLLVAFENDSAATFHHVVSAAVEVWACHLA